MARSSYVGGPELSARKHGQRSDERVNSRNGYRQREWDTRAGTIDLAIPKLRQGLNRLTERRHRSDP